MGNFVVDQRWTSEGEPELGVGIVTEVTKGRVQLRFLLSDETRMYATQDAPLRRVEFKPGETIVDVNNATMDIEQVHENAGLFIYLGKDRVLSEVDLGDVTVKHGVDDRLFMGDVDTPDEFALRRKTLQLDYQRRISPINGFIGGRIDLIPHQLYIAHEVSSRYAPRVLLSDQVGLGKTIEACLILHRLLLSGRISRVLILVPDSLVHQWFVEMLRRFNLWFHIFDEERCTAIEQGAPEGNPFLDDQLVICNASFLANSPLRTKQALDAKWDMLVVDEAHHLEWSVDKVSPEYGIVELLSKVAKGLLLLTATPEQLGVESHFARLRLLDPERYSDYDEFINESQDHKVTANIVDELTQGKTLSTESKKLLNSTFGEDRINKLENEEERDNLIEDLLDQHGPGRVVFRNTRAAMSGFPNRIANLAPIHNQNNYESITNEFTNDYISIDKPIPKDKFSYTEDLRVRWVVEKLKEIVPAKVLLICKTKTKVLALEKALLELASFKTGVFHEDLTIVQRDRNAAWFAEEDGAQLLICSEIGSEGRNFQFAHHLILFDLPSHPELLEQRIGRLDRIGQTNDIQIHVPYLVGSPQEALVKWYHEGLNAFEENIEAGNQITQLFQQRVLDVALKNDQTELSKIINETKSFQEELKNVLANGRDRLLEMNSFRPKVADKLVQQINKADNDYSLEYYLTRVFEHFRIEMEDLASRSYLLRPSGINDEAFPSIPDEGVSVTFDREKALSREDMSFVSWDHPMATGAIDMVLSTGTGNASFGVFQGEGTPGMLLEVLFVLETAGGQNIQVDRFLPNTPLRIVVDHSGNDVTDSYPSDLFDTHLRPSHMDDIIQNDTIMEVVIPNMMEAATDFAEKLKETKIAVGTSKMNQTLNHEIDRLKILQQKKQNIRPEEVQIALDEQTSLASIIKDARIRLDAMQLINKGDLF